MKASLVVAAGVCALATTCSGIQIRKAVGDPAVVRLDIYRQSAPRRGGLGKRKVQHKVKGINAPLENVVCTYYAPPPRHAH